jgi:RHS repeat-associated protein
MALSRPDPLGVERTAGWVPTDDTARQRGIDPAALTLAPNRWTPVGLTALGHQLTVNIPTGGLVISAVDLAIPYQSLRFRVARSFDAQEQYAQHAYLDSHPNTDPRIHFFANWQLAQETSVSAIWHETFPEILVAEGDVDAGLYYRTYPTFAMNTRDPVSVEARLRAYGVPRRTLAALGWSYDDFDAILRSRQGTLSILAGNFLPETMVDPAVVKLFRFDVTTGTAHRYSSDFAYQQLIDPDGMREVTPQALLVDSADALGHSVRFRPVEPAPPYRSYRVADGTDRAFRLDLGDHVEYLDGELPGSRVKAYVVSRATDETRAAGNTVEYRYDNGRLVEARYPGHAGGPARIRRYGYDARGCLVRITDPVGDTFCIEYVQDDYDCDDRLMPRLKVSRLADGEGNVVAYRYDHAHGQVTVTFTGSDGQTKQIAYSYLEDTTDTRQRYVTSEVIAVQAGFSGNHDVRTSWQYSDDGRYRLMATIDPLGGATRYTYNDCGQVTSQLDALGHERDYQYDTRDEPTTAEPNAYDLLAVSQPNIDGAGNTFLVRSTATFGRYGPSTSGDPQDAALSTHRISTRTDELENTTTFGYDDAGSSVPLRPTMYTDALGRVVMRAYDAAGAIVQQTDPVGSTSRWAYNPQGQLVSFVDPDGYTRYWVYDHGSGWLTDATDALGAAPGDPRHSIHYEWSAAGQLSRARDPGGDITDFAYFANKRIWSITRYDPAAQTTSFAFDASGGLAQITDPRGHTTYFRSDEAGRVYTTYRDAPGNASIALHFDLAGRPVQVTDRNGQVTRYDYDALGRVTGIEEPDWPAHAPANPGKTVAISYDELGRRLRVRDSELAHDSTYSYDAAGNLVHRTDGFGSELRYVYDATNRVVRLHDGLGVVDTRFVRDQAGRVERVVDSAWRDPSRTFRFVRTDGSLVDNLYRIEGPSNLVARFSYDANRRLTETVHERAGSPFATYGYEYRDDGLIGTATGDHSATYGYDGMKRLVLETDSGVADGYDGSGNRVWRAAHAPPAANQNVFDADNRLVQAPADGTWYVYDNNGNLLRRSAGPGTEVTYTYDGANRLRVASGGDWRVAYLYDMSGQLLERRRTQGTATRITRYRYGNRSILASLDGNGNVRALYTRSDSGRLLRSRSAEPLTPAPGSDPHSLCYVHDGLASVVGLFDDDGNEHLGVSYDAWGTAAHRGTASTDPFRYRGGLQDPDTGLLRSGRRWYDPATGRWTSQDPLLTDLLTTQADLAPAYPDLANLYQYVGDDPLNRADPTGLGAFGDFVKWFASTLPGKFLAARMNAAGARPETGVKPRPAEQVKKQSARPKSDEAPQQQEPDPEPEFEEGAGEGSRSPSSERTYNNPKRFEGAGGGPVGAALGIGVTAVVVVVLLPVEVPVAIGAGIVFVLELVFD